MASASSAETSTTVRIGVINTDVSSEPVYADAEGFFGRAELAAKIATFANGGQVLRGLASGTLDIGFVNAVSAIGAMQKGAALTILAPAAIYDRAHPITELVQAANSHYASGRELDGKNVGAPAAGGGGEVFTRAWIDETGGDSRTVHYVIGIPSTKIAAALAAHHIEAGELSEPTLTVETRTGRVKRLADALNVVGSPYYIGVFVAATPWVQDHRAAAHAFVTAVRETALWANAHRAQTAVLLARRLHVSLAITSTMVRARYGVTLSPNLIQPVIDLSVKYGALKPVRAADLIKPL